VTGRRASLAYIGVMAAAIVAVLGAQLAAEDYPQFFIDFKVPYCAAQVMIAGEDPYHIGTLGPCEHAVAAMPLVPPLKAADPTLEPPPIPPYEMVPFLALATLPFPLALSLWMIANIGGCALAADLLRRALPTLHPAFIGITIIVSAIPAGLDLGQFTGIVLLAVTGLGLAVRDARVLSCGAWLALASLQPHVALPAAVSLLLRRTGRIAVAGVAVVLGCISAIWFAHLTIEWVTDVLPHAALVNLIDAAQLSFVSGPATLGVPLPLVSLVAKAIYGIAIVFGAIAGARIAARSGRPEALPWIATALGTLGAPYLHAQQVTLLLPAAFLLVEIGPSRRWAEAAALGIAIPWTALVMQSWGLAFGLGAAFAAWRRPTPRHLLTLALTAIVILAALIGAAYGFTVLRVPEATLSHPLAHGTDEWAAFVVRQAHAFGRATLPARTLTWLSALLLIVLASRAAFGPRTELRSARVSRAV
jgi:hypothetical protein